MEIKKILIDEIIPADYNPRQISDEELLKLKQSIDYFGYVEPIIVNQRSGNIVGGHQRLKALKALGYVDVDCVIVDYDDLKEKQLNIALNRIKGDWDFEVLEKLMNEINAVGEISLTGFDSIEFENLQRNMDNLSFDDDKKEPKPKHNEELEGDKQSEMPKIEIYDLEETPNVNIKGDVENKGDYVIMQFDDLSQLSSFKNIMGMSTGDRVFKHDDFINSIREGNFDDLIYRGIDDLVVDRTSFDDVKTSESE